MPLSAEDRQALAQLGEARAAGIVSEIEFTMLKQEILGARSGGPTYDSPFGAPVEIERLSNDTIRVNQNQGFVRYFIYRGVEAAGTELDLEIREVDGGPVAVFGPFSASDGTYLEFTLHGGEDSQTIIRCRMRGPSAEVHAEVARDVIGQVERALREA